MAPESKGLGETVCVSYRRKCIERAIVSDKVNLQRSELSKKSIQFYLTGTKKNVHDELVVEFAELVQESFNYLNVRETVDVLKN